MLIICRSAYMSTDDAWDLITATSLRNRWHVLAARPSTLTGPVDDGVPRYEDDAGARAPDQPGTALRRRRRRLLRHGRVIGRDEQGPGLRVEADGHCPAFRGEPAWGCVDRILRIARVHPRAGRLDGGC